MVVAVKSFFLLCHKFGKVNHTSKKKPKFIMVEGYHKQWYLQSEVGVNSVNIILLKLTKF